MAEKRVWNSLEVTKLAFSLATPLMLFWLSVAVQRDASSEQRDREAAAEQRAAAERRTALTREESLRRETRASETESREEARREARLARDEAFQREKSLRSEAFVRERQLKEEFDRRDQARRHIDEERQRLDKELQKKFEVWAQIYPVARDLTQKLSSFSWTDEPAEADLRALRVSAIDLGYVVEAHASYFSRDFLETLLKFQESSLDLVESLQRYDEDADGARKDLAAIREAQEAHENLYKELVRTTSSELSPRWPVAVISLP
jgi:hypothetical protein